MTVFGSRLAVAGAAWRGVGLGAVLTVSNPQALLVYIAVLPSVLGSERVAAGQYLLLCLALSAVMAAVATGCIALATRVRSALSGLRRKSVGGSWGLAGGARAGQLVGPLR